MPLLRDEREEVRERAAWTASWLVEQPLSEVATQGRQLVGEPGQAATRILAATFERTATELARMLQEPGSRADVAVIEEVSSGLQKVVAELQKRAESDRDERVRAAARKALAEVRDVVGPLDIEPEGEK